MSVTSFNYKKLCASFRESSCSFLLVSTLVVFLTVTVSAEEKKKDENLPQSGAISSMRNFGTNDQAIDTFGNIDISDRAKPKPITGSVSRAATRDWDVRIFNNSEDDYSIGAELVQFDQSGRKLRSESFSMSLKAGESVTRSVRSRPNAEQTELKITRWTNLSERKRKAEESTEAVAEQAEGTSLTTDAN